MAFVVVAALDQLDREGPRRAVAQAVDAAVGKPRIVVLILKPVFEPARQAGFSRQGVLNRLFDQP
jgi:hypothetical protein